MSTEVSSGTAERGRPKTVAVGSGVDLAGDGGDAGHQPEDEEEEKNRAGDRGKPAGERPPKKELGTEKDEENRP